MNNSTKKPAFFTNVIVNVGPAALVVILCLVLGYRFTSTYGNVLVGILVGWAARGLVSALVTKHAQKQEC